MHENLDALLRALLIGGGCTLLFFIAFPDPRWREFPGAYFGTTAEKWYVSQEQCLAENPDKFAAMTTGAFYDLTPVFVNPDNFEMPVHCAAMIRITEDLREGWPEISALDPAE